jgi:hypothetical protein
VAAVYERATLERGPGEVLLLTQKVKADRKTYENGSRQRIAAIEGEKIRFDSGLELRLEDGRVRQGDAVTTYKAQGASKTEMIRVEDNRSLLAFEDKSGRARMENGGWKTPGSLLGIKVSRNHDRRLLEAVGRSCKEKEKLARKRASKRLRLVARRAGRPEKEDSIQLPEKALLH